MIKQTHPTFANRSGRPLYQSANSKAPWAYGLVAAVALASAGCAGSDTSPSEDEDVGSAEAAFSQASCAAATADQTFSGNIDPAFVSPQSYNTCFKSYVVDVTSLQAAYTGSGTVLNARISAQWGDAPLTTQASCIGSEVAAIFYKKQSGNWVVLKEEHQMGQWVSAFGGSCGFDVNLMGMTAGTTYRVAATARSTSNATRMVSIGTYKHISF